MVNPSKRLEQIPPYLFSEISRIKAEAIANGADIIDFGIGDPDLPTPAAIIQALHTAAQNNATHRYDETPRGWSNFLNAASEWYLREFGVHISPQSEMCQLIGSKEGLAHLAWAYIDPGDVVICPDPGYPVYKVNSLMSGGKIYETPLLEENGFLPKLEDIPTDIAKKAKLFYICYPHNPTGATATLDFYRQAIEFCRDHHILLVNDLAYVGVTFDGYRCPTTMQLEGAKDVCIEFHSLSKLYNMTGWRLGFALGNHDAVATLQKLKSNIDSKQFPAIAEAGAVALQEVSNNVTLKTYQQRRDNLCEGLNSIGWKVNKPKASLYVWAKIPRDDITSTEFAKELLERAHVLVIPGEAYGPSGAGYIRISLTLSGDQNGERFKEAVSRIAKSGLVPNLVQ